MQKSEVEHGQKQSSSTSPSFWQTRQTSLPYKLDTPALKKTAKKLVFEDIKKAFEERMSSEEFKDKNDREHRVSKSEKVLTHLRIDVQKL